MKKLKLYLSGPMSGLPNNNFESFDLFKQLIEEQTAYEVVSPADLDRKLGYAGGDTLTGADLRKVLAQDIEELLSCDAIGLIPGWTESSGARVESHVAKALGLELLALSVGLQDKLIILDLEADQIPDGIPQRI